jgi:secondary thiamine-phosphate synthase enzyme
MKTAEFTVQTSGRETWKDITGLVRQEIGRMGAENGICLVHVPHTTAGITINENADPDVMDDLFGALGRMVPAGGYRHAEGNSTAHVKTTMTGSSVSVTLEGGRLKLGRWQGIYLCEFDGPRTRRVQITLVEG